MNLLINYGLPEEKKFFNISNLHTEKINENTHKIAFITLDDKIQHLEICTNYYVAKYGKTIEVIDPKSNKKEIVTGTPPDIPLPEWCNSSTDDFIPSDELLKKLLFQ